MGTQELITVEQLPVITERLALLSQEIDENISNALSLECATDTVKAVKALRAELTKSFALLEDRRKAVKSSIMAPYEKFEAVYKQYVSDKYKSADAQLRGKVDAVEADLKRQKYEALRLYFDEYRLSRNIDFVNMDTWHPNITLSASLKALKADGKAYIDRICEDLALIETQEHKTEVLVEYRRSLNVSQAVTTVTERHRAMEDQERRQEELAAQKAAKAEALARIEAVVPPPLAPPEILPKVEDDPVLTLSFRVTAMRSKLRELKKFLDDGGYQYE